MLAPWSTPHGLPPFEQFEPVHFRPALEWAMQAHRDELRAIAQNPAAADFDNTVAALDRSGRLLSRVVAVFMNLNGSHTSAQLQAVQREMAAPLAAHHNAMYLDAALFARLDALAQQRERLDLDDESLRLLDRVHLDFVLSGARLAQADRERFAQVMEELAQCTTAFGQNVLHDEATFQLPLHGPADLQGLPDFVVDAARQAAVDRGLGDDPQAHLITLSRSLIVPFLTFSPRRDLREQAWRAWTQRGSHAGEHDNRPLVRRILQLRREQARLLGHENYADFALVDRMAGKAAAVWDLLDQVWPRALQAAQRERALLLEAMQDAGQGGQPLQEWDWRYWAEKVRVARFALDEAELKPYFELDRMVQAAFDCAQRLFGLRFEHRAELPVYHPDVRAYEVRDSRGELVGLFLQDNFARASKRSGAWMSALRWGNRNCADTPGGVTSAPGSELPVILNNNNFAKGAAGSPTLLSLDDVRTLFHEFGHGLHGLLSKVRFERLSGTQVLRDFVELPSQLFEHWMSDPAVLKRHARHWRSEEPIPDVLLERIDRAKRFNQGYETVRYTASALIDMAVHSLPDAEPPADIEAFEQKEMARRGLPPAVGMNHRLTHFQHLFSGSGYAAGYYVYLWAEVLEADAWEAFVEAGDPFDPQVARALEQHIYSAGNSRDPTEAYLAFRGRAAAVQPMLRQRGLMEATPAAALA